MTYNFPDPKNAPKHSPLAYGGDLSSEALLGAYKKGIFPWFMEGEEILWWSPDPRAVLYPKEVRVQKSIKPFLKKYKVKFDSDFTGLITLCKNARSEPTWISDKIIAAYTNLHNLGFAHSVEVYENDELIGGLYGLILGKIFCGESMISIKANASKVALIALCKALDKFDFIIDAQVMNPHLKFMGALNLNRDEFLNILDIKKEEFCGFDKFSELIS
ncbi:leucyl/phenylalanyl-tRNA--protein transferase [Campylobacter hyointestinalis]|uniref:leucyl/phenylalanyl-tRNA--protein transferase n=1 Tax=Campylobacter hyointestinalis TaxID=198 RepID=UPI000CE2D40F|nr:leucyl/phenylalanyl-tRNA--protein transferase [Campylobacter hyointestinalis]PPB64025.1 leucyl/phenylalanyl-tRNA--protein transferase [Campylobacter hyointestinalis subsp. hyointestinalis]